MTPIDLTHSTAQTIAQNGAPQSFGSQKGRLGTIRPLRRSQKGKKSIAAPRRTRKRFLDHSPIPQHGGPGQPFRPADHGDLSLGMPRELALGVLARQTDPALGPTTTQNGAPVLGAGPGQKSKLPRAALL
jgi:hypothetical protein